MQIVKVTWVDSCGGLGWRDRAEWMRWLESDGSVHETVGFLFEKNREYLAVAQSRQLKAEPNFDAMLQIPMGCVKRVRFMR